MISLPSWAEHTKLEWLKTNAKRQALYQYLTFTHQASKPDGPIFIYTHQVANFGYVSYAYNLAEVVRKRYPNKAIQVIIKGDPDEYPQIKNLFDFEQIGKPIEIAYITSADSDDDRELLQRWANESSLIINAASHIDTFVSSSTPCVRVEQIGNMSENSGINEYELTEYINHYRLQLLPMKGFEQEKIQRKYFRTIGLHVRGFTFAPEIGNTTIPTDILARQMRGTSRNERKKDAEYIFGRIRDEPTTGFNLECGELTTGFSKSASGMLNRPFYSELKELLSETGKFDNLLEQFPALHQFLKEFAIRDNDTSPRYHMAYMHNVLAKAEYLAMLSYLNPKEESVVLGNINQDDLNHPVMQSMLKKHGVSRVYWHDLKQGHAMEWCYSDCTEEDSKRTLRVARLPSIKSDPLYQSLFFESQNPVGVTGNQSLFMAIAYGKLPFYDTNLGAQSSVRSHLANYDLKGQLNDFFSKKINPKRKADIVQHGSHAITEWSQTILQYKNLNNVLEEYMDLALNPSPEVEDLLWQVHNHENLPSAVLPEDPLLKDVVLVKRFFQMFHQKIDVLDASISVSWLRQEIQKVSFQLQDAGFREWFLEVVGI